MATVTQLDVRNLDKDFTPRPNCLQDRVILITGAANGIGRSIAKGFAQQGAQLILLDQDVKGLEAVHDQITENCEQQPALYPLNLANATPKDYQEMFERIEKEFNKCDGIVFNAAKVGNLTPIEHYPLKQWFEIMQINLNSSFLITHAAIPLLKKQPSNILFTQCDQGQKGKAFWGAYAVSKFGIQGLIEVLSAELADYLPIKVNGINPGPTETMLRLHAFPAEDRSPLKKPDQLLNAYLYLMSEDSGQLHGQVINL